jgi:hypothetical protein
VATTKEAALEWMEVEALRRMVKRWEDDQKGAVVVTDQDSKMAKVIRESRWNVKHEYDPTHGKKALDRHCQGLPKEERQLLYGLGKRSQDWFNHVLHQLIPRDKKTEMWENTLNHNCGDHSKCHHPAHQDYQSKNRDMPEAQASLRRCLTEGSKIIQEVDPVIR